MAKAGDLLDPTFPWGRHQACPSGSSFLPWPLCPCTSGAGAVVCKNLSRKWPLNVPLWSRAALEFVLPLMCSAEELLEDEGCWLMAYVYPPLHLCADSAFFQASRTALPPREFTCPLVQRGFPLLSLALRAQKFPGKVRTQAARNQSLQWGLTAWHCFPSGTQATLFIGTG